MIRDLRHDLGYALRLFRRAPAFTALAVGTLALGIGSTTAMFTVVHAVLLRPLPYPDAHRLVILRADSATEQKGATLADAEIADARAATRTFEHVGAIVAVDGNLTNPDAMERVPAASITDDLLPALGIKPAIGRFLDNRIDSATDTVLSILISDELWRRRFRADPSLVGKQMNVNNKSLTVVGILPRGFRLYLGRDTNIPDRIDVWFPTGLGTDRRSRFNTAIARLAPGVTLVQAREELDSIARRAADQFPQFYSGRPPRFYADPLHDDAVRAARPALVALMGAVAFVLLIACANIANLLLARTTARGRELAVRSAMGASGGRLIRQLLTEGALLGVCGGAAGLLLAMWGQSALERLRPAAVPSMPANALDMPVLLFAVSLSFIAAIAFSLAPAVHGLRSQPVDALKVGSRGQTLGAGRLRSALVVAEVALSILLLTGAGIMIRTVVALREVSTGFDPQQVITVQASLQPRAFSALDLKARFYEDALARVAAIPGVQSASAVRPLPLEGMVMPERIGIESTGVEIVSDSHVSLPGYFRTMGIRQVAGRDFTSDDVSQRRPAIIVDETFAARAWPGARALGRRIQVRTGTRAQAWAEVVGVVGHVRATSLRDEGRPQVYLPYHSLALFDLAVVIKSPGDPTTIAAAARRAIEGLGGNRPVHRMTPMTTYVDEAMADARFAVVVLGVFAVLALLLCAVGIYGVIAVSTAQRTREFGVRLALGADRARILLLVLREGMTRTGAGIAIGMAASLVLVRYLDTLVYGVHARDPLTLLFVSIVLFGVAVLACYVPARRASRLEPSVALRAE